MKQNNLVNSNFTKGCYIIIYVILVLLSISINITYSQDLKNEFVGIYRDYPAGYTELCLVEDGTFTLTMYGQNHQGQWKAVGNEIVLNPEKSKRYPKISFSEQKEDTLDAIEIKFNYQIETYENETFVEFTDYEIDLLAVYINKPKHYVNVVRQPLRTYCAFSPRIKNQVILHSETNSIKIKKPKKGITKIGVHAPDFDQPIVLNVTDPLSNRFEIFIVHPVDKEKMLRSKSVVIKGNRAYYYERNGKVYTGFFATPLLKVKQKQ